MENTKETNWREGVVAQANRPQMSITDILSEAVKSGVIKSWTTEDFGKTYKLVVK